MASQNWKDLGSGLVAGACDNDPTTVASLAVIGATTTYGLSWLVVLVIPMLMVVQVVGATVGVAARAGLEDVIRTRFGRYWALAAMVAILAVNLITLAADLDGGSAALGLISGLPEHWFVLPFASAAAALLIWGNYESAKRVLQYVLLVFLTYILTAFLAHPHWNDVLKATLTPHLSLAPGYTAGALALLGTTLTSYAYVWETIEQSEERPSLKRLGAVRLDAGIGMAAAGVVFWFIVVGTGATLGAHHKPVETAQDAAAALAPLVGRFSSDLFGIGLLASAVLAVPVLAGTSAYVMAEMFGWRGSLDERFQEAPAFYGALLLSLAFGAAVTFLHVGAIKLLFFASIAGGLGTPLTLGLMMVVARDKKIMRNHQIDARLAAAGWVVTGIVTCACGIFLWQTAAHGG
ncbi:MAG: divalent metal cation transporter [Candidatus Eremiobacteraeota bacterium]|nr:divalent metal cation transporter [Candidatus Eremiobacteraeota bacterium]